jgi:hypothetical protein
MQSQSGIIPLAFDAEKLLLLQMLIIVRTSFLGTGLIVAPNEKRYSNAIINLYLPEIIIQYGINALEYLIKELSWEKSAATLWSSFLKVK